MLPGPVNTPEHVARRYDRLAGFYGALSLAFGLRPSVRRAAVSALALRGGDAVLEVGCGRGDNLGALRAAVGEGGLVVGIDVSPGMLERAESRRRHGGWQNVELLCQDAADLEVSGPFEAILFSLSYSVMEARQATLASAWRLLRPGGQLVVMDAGLPDNVAGRLLGPLTRALSRATVLGDPATRPWRDLDELGAEAISVRWMAPGTYFVCSARKPV
ncbi:MAG TPA: methyltransferase domain-containing protein [Solirubrobacterales bacterium]|nr:methyltransferase domain-containing protein [Solirubrobacterales bacterium]